MNIKTNIVKLMMTGAVMVVSFCSFAQGSFDPAQVSTRINELTDDFEDPNWMYDQETLTVNNGKWQLTAFKGRLRTVETRDTPIGGLAN